MPHPGAQGPETILLSLTAAGWTVAFDRCPEVVDGLEAILNGWGLARDGSEPPDATISRSGGRYSWHSDARSKPVLWDKRPPVTAMNVISDVHDVLFDWFLADHPELLCLHTGAAAFGTGLVCFPSTRKAGKSTLCVALAARGHQFYCDDVLPVDPRSLEGIAMGIAPLLRKPLPMSLGSPLTSFIAGRAGPASENWTYVGLREPHIAAFGQRRRIGALVLLDRRDASPPSLEPIAGADMLREVIQQNFGARSSPALVLDSLGTLVDNVECLRLIYSDVARAADALSERFA